MDSFIIYDRNGSILRTGTAPESMHAIQPVDDSELVMAGIADMTVNYIGDGVIQTFTEEELAVKNNLPAGFVWSMPDRVATDTRTLGEAKLQKLAIMRAACLQQIVGGFYSSALGAQHDYPAKPLDQSNLIGSVVSSLMPDLPAEWRTLFWCADVDGVWAFVEHTAAQIQQVGTDGKAATLAAMSHNELRAWQIDNAISIAYLDGLIW